MCLDAGRILYKSLNRSKSGSAKEQNKEREYEPSFGILSCHIIVFI